MRLGGNDVGLVEQLNGVLVKFSRGSSNSIGYSEEDDLDELRANRLRCERSQSAYHSIPSLDRRTTHVFRASSLQLDGTVEQCVENGKHALAV